MSVLAKALVAMLLLGTLVTGIPVLGYVVVLGMIEGRPTPVHVDAGSALGCRNQIVKRMRVMDAFRVRAPPCMSGSSDIGRRSRSPRRCAVAGHAALSEVSVDTHRHAKIGPNPALPMEEMMSTLLLLLALTPANASPLADADTLAAIEATCLDYVDGQLEADPARVARSLHPDLAKRAVLGDTPDERLGLRRMSKEELVALTRQGALKTPKAEWSRSCRVLDVTGNVASVRLETPWFVDYFHMGRFDQRWIIVNALWYPKSKP